MKNIIFVFFLVFGLQFLHSQEHAWVYFKDKPNAASFMSTPLTMLTQKALDRRSKQNINIDITDVPIERTYIESIIGNTGIAVKAKSKWLNALHILGSEIDILALENLSFVDRIEFAANDLNNRPQNTKLTKNKFNVKTTFNYGSAANQIEMLKGDFLHQQDFTGTGMTIAVLDGGFPNVNVFSAFQR